MSRRKNSKLRDTDRLGLNQRLRPGLQRRLHDQIYRPIQMVFEPEFEAHVLGQARRFPKLDQNVDVAFRSGFIPGHGAKEGEGADAEPILELLPVGGEEFEHLVAFHGFAALLRSIWAGSCYQGWIAAG